MQINLYLSNIEKEIKDITNTIELCNETRNKKLVKTLKRLLHDMERSFEYPNEIREKFVSELKKNKEFVQANIFKSSTGDFTVDILLNEFNDKIKENYKKICELYSEINDMFFTFEIFNFNEYDFEEANEYDYLKCVT